ncbi:MAG: flippase activity-associated protein Agl23 [Halobacterium sp.]
MSRSRDEWSGRRRAAAALVAVAALALLARLWALGWRVAHQDEARVAHWTLRYMDTGAWQYRPIIHGPFLPHVNGVVFDLLGPSDFSMRLVVAVAGSLLVVTPYLLRDRLSNAEMVATGLFFAANPVLLYYSRFMRNDLLLAAFMFTALGLFVRAVDTGESRYLYAAALPFALAFTTKENALLYPVCWVGALALVFDGHLVLAGASDDRTRYGVVRDHVRQTARAAWRHKADLLGSLVLFAGVVVAFYAPKPELYHALSDPSLLPGVLREATLGSWNEFISLWGEPGERSYFDYLLHDLTVLSTTAAALVAFAVLGFFHERYATEEPRAVVSLCFYWGVFSVFGYPIVMDILAAWATIHAIVPLAVPAGVGVAVVFERGRAAVAAGNAPTARAVAVVLLVVAAGTGAVAVQTSYEAPQSEHNPLVQYAQPGGHMQPVIKDMKRISATNDGVDVLFYDDADDDGGDVEFHNDGDRTFNVTRGYYEGWHQRLPFPWYLAHVDANVTSVETTEAFPADPPPVIISVEKEEDDFASKLDGYQRYAYPRYLTHAHNTIVIYVDQSALPAE